MSDDSHEYDEEVFTTICEVHESFVLGDPLYKKGFEAGAASRDAEVVSLTNQRDYEYVLVENAEQERDQLREQVKMLRDVVGHVAGMRFSIVTTKMCEAALAATEPK